MTSPLPDLDGDLTAQVNMSEAEVLAAVAAWLEHDLAARLRHSEQLVAGVRLADIPTRDIATMLDRPGLR